MSDRTPVTRADDSVVTLEDALLDPAHAERIRASVDGEWLDVDEPTGADWNFAIAKDAA